MVDSEFQFEIVVVGGGPAGLAAACTAAESGCRVGLVEATPWLGGQIWRGEPLGAPASRRHEVPPSGGKGQQLNKTAGNPTSNRLKAGIHTRRTRGLAGAWLSRFLNSGATVLDGTSVIAVTSPSVLLAEHDSGPRQIHWKRLILATGARELFLPFPGWTLPGVVGAGGLQAMVKNGWPIENQRIVVGGSGPLLLAVADGLAKRGGRVISIAEQAPRERVLGFGLGLCLRPEKLWQGIGIKFRLGGVKYRLSTWPVRAEGDEQLRRVTLTNGKATWSEECDLFACGFGLVPNVELPLALGCALEGDNVKVDDWQGTTTAEVYCAGEPTGIGGLDCALVEGRIAGYAAAGRLEQARSLFNERASWHRFRAALAKAFALRPELKSLAKDETIVCRCEDVTLGQLRAFSQWRDAKLQSRCGMGACQGRVCGEATKFLFGWGMESVRPPIMPARVTSLISQADGALPPAS